MKFASGGEFQILHDLARPFQISRTAGSRLQIKALDYEGLSWLFDLEFQTLNNLANAIDRVTCPRFLSHG